MFSILKHLVFFSFFEIQCIMSNDILFFFMQGGNTTTLSTHVGQIELKLLNITGTIAQVLETCNENAKSIQCLNTTIFKFM